MLALEEVELRRGAEPLLQGASATLHDGWKVGVVGRNGSGKSSLFALLLGELSPDAGRVTLPDGARIAWMAQEIADLEATAVEYVLAGHFEWVAIQEAIAAAEAAGDDHRLAHLYADLDAIDGYTVRNRAEQLLAGLGFSETAMGAPVGSFSGGWRMRLNLARALIRPSDFLLLDEPTNHLDLETVDWLEQWLRGYSGTLLLVAHDRDFLDSVCDHILHFDGGELTLYNGGYSEFERQRAEEMARRQAMYEKQQQRVAEIERFVARFRAQASKARQAQSRLKELERMETIAPAHADSPFRFSFPASERSSNPLLAIKEATLGYPETPVLSGVDLTLLPERRIGLLGPNGAGKSTLVRAIAEGSTLLDGERVAGEHLAVGYFAQHQLEALNPDASPLEHLRQEGGATDQRYRDFLGGFGFVGDMATSPVVNFSGGERARLALALIAWRRPNLLLLDEPTNHLDLEMRHALDMALQEFSGTVVLVTHDRHLLRDSVDDFLLVHGGKVRPFDGDLEDYRRWLRESLATPAAGSEKAAGGGKAPGPDPGKGKGGGKGNGKGAGKGGDLKALQNRLRKAERALTEAGEERERVQQALAEPELYTDPARADELADLQRREGELARKLADAEEEWLAAGEAVEAAGGGTG
ncbi:ATP-binding cassette, subfamily F, member 3 [Thiohalospira halophila DSM 15071]|uniref:Probable ATP-binding protein YheS n=1 Tax=Thiohalospira halophila DSM 15071 TaxID=1123397 RepID=A0A1I1RZT0_9GAMM|nr:ATP-binding cassette domain-containing protein [Thiohalospira halophila]SFD37818.1 ATP-binding cassette, subfamily F, member 3 [Thiohalospira halophila DSM 15071]